MVTIKPSQVIPIKQIERGVLMPLPTEKVAFDFGKATVTAIEAHEFLDRPVAPNDTETGRKVNRRVELIVIGETVANITRGEPPGSFEEAFSRLRELIEPQGLVPTKGN